MPIEKRARLTMRKQILAREYEEISNPSAEGFEVYENVIGIVGLANLGADEHEKVYSMYGIAER